MTVAIIQGGLGLAVAGLLFSLHRLTRQRHLPYWAAAWLILAVLSVTGSLALVAGVESGVGLALGLLSVFIAYFQTPALALAALSLGRPATERLPHAAFLGGTAALALALVVAAGALPLSTPMRAIVCVLPSYFLLSLANGWFAVAFARYSPHSRAPSGRLVVLFSLLSAVHLMFIGLGWGGVEIYREATLPAVVGLLLPMGITTGIVLSVIQDATEAAERLRESEATNRALVEAIPDTLFVLDRQGVFQGFLPAKDFHPEFPPEWFLGKRAEEVFPAEHARTHQLHLARAKETGRTQAYEYTAPREGWTGHFEARLTLGAGDFVFAIVRDVTRRKQAESEREELIAELEKRNDELEAKTTELERFTYTVSHDLKSPLVTILGFLGFAERSLASGDADRARADFARIRSAAERMERLLKELLQLSRIGRVMSPHESVSVALLAREAVALLASTISASGALVEIEEGLPTVWADPGRLREVMQNLLENALRFSAGRPEVHVTVGSRGRDEHGQDVVFVRDDGIGIDPRHQERIFRLFEKLDPGTDGTGVGLTIVKRIIEVHGGRIWVESEGEGHGSTFCFTLPPRETGAVV